MEFMETLDMKKNERFCMWLYAKPGGGKTSTVRYLKGKTLIVDIDGSGKVLSGVPNITRVTINPQKPADELTAFYGFAKTNIEKYDNIVIDNLSHYQKLWLMEKSKTTKTGQPEIQHYGVFDNHLLNMVESFKALDANIVFTAWETTRQIQLENQQLFHQFLPDIRDKVVNHIMGVIPVVGRLVKNPDTGVRGYLLSESNGTFAKNQLDNREFALQTDIFEIGDIDNGVQTS